MISCVNGKAKDLGCDKEKDSEIELLKKQHEDALLKIKDLETKISKVLEFFATKDLQINKEENVVDNENIIVNSDNNIIVENNTEKTAESPVNNLDLLNKKVENPSQHLIDNSEINVKETKIQLDAFEKNVVETYNRFKNDYSLEDAEVYLSSVASYLPRGFHPEKI